MGDNDHGVGQRGRVIATATGKWGRCEGPDGGRYPSEASQPEDGRVCSRRDSTCLRVESIHHSHVNPQISIVQSIQRRGTSPQGCSSITWEETSDCPGRLRPTSRLPPSLNTPTPSHPDSRPTALPAASMHGVLPSTLSYSVESDRSPISTGRRQPPALLPVPVHRHPLPLTQCALPT